MRSFLIVSVIALTGVIQLEFLHALKVTATADRVDQLYLYMLQFTLTALMLLDNFERLSAYLPVIFSSGVKRKVSKVLEYSIYSSLMEIPQAIEQTALEMVCRNERKLFRYVVNSSPMIETTPLKLFALAYSAINMYAWRIYGSWFSIGLVAVMMGVIILDLVTDRLRTKSALYTKRSPDSPYIDVIDVFRSFSKAV